MTLPAEDRRSVADLFEAAFEPDDDAAWDAVAALHRRGSRDVFDRALALTHSDEPAVRARGVDILGQLGIPERSFPDECFVAALRLLADGARQVRCAAIFALQHLDSPRAAPHIIPFADDEDDATRYAVAFALGGVDTPEANRVLLTLMRDRDADVRNWAAFGLGTQSDADDGEIREGLANALEDGDQDVRYEATIGLGRRRDGRALAYLKTWLRDDPDDVSARDAAAKLLGLDDDENASATDLLSGLDRRQ